MLLPKSNAQARFPARHRLPLLKYQPGGRFAVRERQVSMTANAQGVWAGQGTVPWSRRAPLSKDVSTSCPHRPLSDTWPSTLPRVSLQGRVPGHWTAGIP